MQVYLAAGFSRKKEIADRADELRTLGIGVTSTWPWESAPANSQLGDVSEEYLRTHGQRDIDEIDAADAIILFTQEPTKPFCRGGRMHEFGYAQGKRKRLIIVGPRENIFHYLPEVEVYHSWEAFLQEARKVWKGK